MVIERREIITPFLANRDSSASISIISFIFWVITARQHGAINTVFGRLTHVMRNASWPDKAISIATAGFCSAFSQVIADSDNCITATTLATPERAFRFAEIALNNGKAVEYLTSKVDKLCHWLILSYGIVVTDLGVASRVTNPAFRDTSLATLLF
jgi:hypothetical protein